MKRLLLVAVVTAMTSISVHAAKGTVIPYDNDNKIKIHLKVAASTVTSFTTIKPKRGTRSLATDIDLGTYSIAKIKRGVSYALPLFVRTNISSGSITMDINAPDGNGNLKHEKGVAEIPMKYELGGKAIDLVNDDAIEISTAANKGTKATGIIFKMRAGGLHAKNILIGKYEKILNATIKIN